MFLGNFSLCCEELYVETKADAACVPCHTATAPAPTLLSSFSPVPSGVLTGGSSGPLYISTHQHKDIFSWILWQCAPPWAWHLVYFISLTVTGERYGYWSLATAKLFEINSVRRRGGVEWQTACSDGKAWHKIILFSKQEWKKCCAVFSTWGLLDLCCCLWLVACCSWVRFSISLLLVSKVPRFLWFYLWTIQERIVQWYSWNFKQFIY